MMKPRGAGAWWTAAMALGLLSGGSGVGGFDLRTPMGWLVIALALGSVACIAVAVRERRRAA